MTTAEEKPINLRGLDHYDSLVKAEIQRIVDNAVFYEPGDGEVEGELPLSEINDELTGAGTTWSSEKIANVINEAAGGSLKIFRRLSEIDLSFTAKTPINTIIAAMPDDTGLIADIVIDDESRDVYPEVYGTLFIYKIRKNRVSVEYVANVLVGTNTYNKRWIGQSNEGVFGGWDEIAVAHNVLSVHGGTLLGDLRIAKEGSDRIASMQSNLQEQAAIFYNYKDDYNYTALVVRPETGSTDSLLQVNTRSGDTQNSYNVYHSGNLPTALQANDAGVVEVLSADAAQTFAVYHEGNAPTAEVVGAAPVEDHNIRTYTSLDQIGLSNDDMSSTDFLANIKAINTALGDGDTILYLTTTNADNLHLSTVDKLNADTGKSLDGSSTLSIKISRTGNIYNAITTDVVYNSGEEATYIYSCIYNKEADAADDTLSKFVITSHPEGFVSKEEVSSDSAMELLCEIGIIDPITNSNGELLIDENGNIFTI